MRAWAAPGPASVESRFDALHASGLTELVGREEELELLLRRWSKAKTGEGQVVLLSGEPGIGKSRLTAALLEHVASEPHTRLRYFCSPQHTDSAFYPDHQPDGTCRWNYARRGTARQNSTSSLQYWRRPQPPSRTPHSLLRCYHCRTMAVIPRSIPTRNDGGKEH